MQKITELLLTKTQFPLINSCEIKLLYPSSQSRFSAVKRALKANELIQLRRGLYTLADALRREKIDLFELANHIYEPSYVSLESALSFHGLIPEAVYKVTSASALRSRDFKNPFGEFVYEHVGCEPFLNGVRRVETDRQRVFFVAEAERAICDLVFVRKLKWTGVEFFTESLRIEEADLQNLSSKNFIRIAEGFKSGGVRPFIAKLVKELF